MAPSCWKHLVFSALLSVELIGGFRSIACAAGSPVNVDVKVDVVDLVKEVASWVRGIVARGEQSEKQRVANSTPRLVGLLTNLAGQKKGLRGSNRNPSGETRWSGNRPSHVLYVTG